jgi:CrcB protein
MNTLLYVGAGGFIGAAGRFLVSGYVQRLVPSALFPWGTLVVNVIGCLLIGLLAGLAEGRQFFGPDARAFLMIGVLGGFTTFSSFGYDTYMLMRGGDFLRAWGNVLLHMTIALGAVWAGFRLSMLFGGKA